VCPRSRRHSADAAVVVVAMTGGRPTDTRQTFLKNSHTTSPRLVGRQRTRLVAVGVQADRRRRRRRERAPRKCCPRARIGAGAGAFLQACRWLRVRRGARGKRLERRDEIVIHPKITHKRAHGETGSVDERDDNILLLASAGDEQQICQPNRAPSAEIRSVRAPGRRRQSGSAGSARSLAARDAQNSNFTRRDRNKMSGLKSARRSSCTVHGLKIGPKFISTVIAGGCVPLSALGPVRGALMTRLMNGGCPMRTANDNHPLGGRKPEEHPRCVPSLTQLGRSIVRLPQSWASKVASSSFGLHIQTHTHTQRAAF
jgi:hypothetical protein